MTLLAVSSCLLVSVVHGPSVDAGSGFVCSLLMFTVGKSLAKRNGTDRNERRIFWLAKHDLNTTLNKQDHLILQNARIGCGLHAIRKYWKVFFAWKDATILPCYFGNRMFSWLPCIFVSFIWREHWSLLCHRIMSECSHELSQRHQEHWLTLASLTVRGKLFN